MKLISATNEYKAINLIKRGARYSVYRCVSRDGRGYLLYKFIKDELLENALVVRFGDISPDFDGFSELFADSGDSLVLVFKDNILERTVNDLLDGDTAERERLDILERSLEALCVHEVPPDIACDLLENGNIGVKSDGSADCLYILSDFFTPGKRDMTALSVIFAKKLTQALSNGKRSAAVEKFCENLRLEPPESMTDLYDRYLTFVEAQKSAAVKNSPKARLMKAVNIGKTLLTAAVLVMAAAILVMSFFEDGQKNTQKLDKIGEVLIEERG